MWRPCVSIYGKKSGHASVIANLVRHLLYGEKLVTPGESGVASLELANAIMLSSRENRWIKLPINRAKYDALLAKLRHESKFVKQAVQVKRITDPKHKA